MNLTVWGRTHLARTLPASEEEMMVEEIDIMDIEDHGDIPVMEADMAEEGMETGTDPEPDDNDWQEVYDLNGCSTFFG
jgi:hypothetical protein